MAQEAKSNEPEQSTLTDVELAHQAELAEAKQIIAEQADLIAKFNAENAALKAAPDATPTFHHGEDVYAVGMAEFIYNGHKYTAQQLLEDEALQAELIDKGVGYISRLNHPSTDAE